MKKMFFRINIIYCWEYGLVCYGIVVLKNGFDAASVAGTAVVSGPTAQTHGTPTRPQEEEWFDKYLVYKSGIPPRAEEEQLFDKYLV